MANHNTTDAQKGGLFSNIKRLDSKSGWLQWDKDIRNALLFAGFNDILSRQTEIPAQRNRESEDAYSERLGVWEDKQARALAAVRDRCGHNAEAVVKACQTITQAL
jgi:hypothetical protein